MPSSSPLSRIMIDLEEEDGNFLGSHFDQDDEITVSGYMKK